MTPLFDGEKSTSNTAREYAIHEPWKDEKIEHNSLRSLSA